MPRRVGGRQVGVDPHVAGAVLRFAGVGVRRGDIDAIALSDDGRWMAFTLSNATNDSTAATSDGEWVLWHLVPQKLAQRIVVKDSGRLRAIGFAAADGWPVVTGSDDGRLRLWAERSAGRESKQFRVTVPVESIALPPEPGLVAVGAGKYFAIWNYPSAQRDFATMSQTGDVTSVAFSPTGQHVCWAGGPSVQCLEVESKRPVATLTGFKYPVLSLAYTPDATRLFTATADGKLQLWWMNRRAKVAE
jgi:WD40 repeat protein